MGDQDHRALELGQRVLERLAALDVEVVGGLVEDQDVGAGGDQDRQREPPLLAAGDVGELLLDVGAGEEEAAEQAARLLAGEAGLALGGVEHGALPGGRVGVLGEVAELDVVAGADAARRRARGARRGSRSGSSCRCRWRRRGRRARRARLRARRRRAASRPGTSIRAVDHLQHDPAGPLRRFEGEAQVAGVAGFGRPARPSSSCRSA